ncbi:Fe-S cluster assembly protein SufB [Paucilactobacillus kaifaensis]|uniref:Fe-S cluster assembly protein SufB n=1 Tax=Paucilactobacillus kaifaensis TaxID=2559921 RepID=UPI0010F5F5AC|nr:Fe-S cluster assembly protein SufB [Paucilactobacillus kaifaensis]
MTNKNVLDDLQQEDYQYGFQDQLDPLFTTGTGLNENVIREISKQKDEPDWMLEIRLTAYHQFLAMKMPTFGPNLSELNLEQINYFQRSTNAVARKWSDVPDQIKTTFEKIGVPQAEREYLAGASAQYESEAVYANLKQDLKQRGIIFMDTDSALREYPELVHEYFAQLVPSDNNIFAALNTAVWSGGTFIYVPKGVHADVPIQSFFRINAGNTGQFERTLIIVDEGGSVNYVEGCTAPTYSDDSLHAAVVEVFVKRDAFCRYTTIQNWSDNVYSLETKRASAAEKAVMEWVDGNLGSKVTMKYPSIYLTGAYAKGTMLSIAFANGQVDQDTGAQMIHQAPHTSSTIISKSICRAGGICDYRGKVAMNADSHGSSSHVECDTIIMDDQSTSDTIPYNQVEVGDVTLEHEAKVSKVSEEELYYLMSRGLSESEATKMIVMGFIEPFTQQLPMEYAVELNRLIDFQMEGSIG